MSPLSQPHLRRNGALSVLETGETAAAWCLSWGSMKTFWPQTSAFLVLVRIPNHTVIEALTPHCYFVFTPTLTQLKCAAISGAPRKYTYSLASSPPLCAWVSGVRHVGISMCVHNVPRLVSLQPDTSSFICITSWLLKKYMTCQHDSGLHLYTAHAH